MNFGLLPVKAPAEAKRRLSELLTREQREQLARIMFEEVLVELLAVRGLDRVVVASSDAEVLLLAAAAGATVLPEAEQNGHSSSADRAARLCMEWGATTLLLVPIDVPLVKAGEMEALLEMAAEMTAPRLVIVPSADGTGTNAMVRTPPDLIESRFGPNSLPVHLEQARARGAAIRVAHPPGLVLDLDTPEDVNKFLKGEPAGKTATFLRDQISHRGTETQSRKVSP